MADTSGPRGKSEFLKRLTAGKTLCSEVNKASSNAKFLHMRRFKAFVSQLESAKQSMLVENERAQKDMRKQLEVYKRRKQSIFRDRVMISQQQHQLQQQQQQQQQQSLGGDEEDEEEGERTLSLPPPPPLRSATSLSSRSKGNKSSCYSVSLPPSQSLPGSHSSHGMFPAIMRLPLMTAEDDSVQSAIQRQLQQQMRKQQSMHAQILRSRVYEFCNDLDNLQDGFHTFYITSPKRRIAFSEGTKTDAETPPGPSLPGNLKTSLVSAV